jgi:hypothetical protein
VKLTRSRTAAAPAASSTDGRDAAAARRRIRLSPSMLVAISALVLAAAGGAAAAIPDTPGGTVHVCYDPADANRDASGARLGIIDKARNPRGCDSDEVELTLNQKGVKGDNGTNGKDGKDGVSGYEYIEKTYPNLSLPISDAYEGRCPAGKAPLGGGALVQLYSPSKFLHLGNAPLYSLPAVTSDNKSGSWFARIEQSAVDGATSATVTVRVTCATPLP